MSEYSAAADGCRGAFCPENREVYPLAAVDRAGREGHNNKGREDLDV